MAGADGEGGPVRAAVALAGGGVVRLEVDLPPLPPPSSSSAAATAGPSAAPSLALRSGAEGSGRNGSDAEKVPEKTQQRRSPSPSRIRGSGGNRKREQQKEGGSGGGGNSISNNNNHSHSPVGAAGRAVAGLTAAAVGALPRALFRTFSGNNVIAAAAAATPVEVKCLAFSRDASLLACGGEDGIVRLLSWPALKAVAEVRPTIGSSPASPASASTSGSSGGGGGGGDGVRDLDFGASSTDGKAHLLAVVLDSGAASVWRVGAGVSSAAPLAALPPPPRPLEAAKASAAAQRARGGRAPLPPRPATVARLRFDRAPPPATVRLLAAVNHPASGGFLSAASARATSSPADPGAPPLVLSWSPLPALAAAAAAAAASCGDSPAAAAPPTKTLPPPPPPKKVLSAPITAFDLSACGKLLGAGSSDGDVVVARSDDLSVVAVNKGKHMVFVTAVSFSPPSSSQGASASLLPALLSVSADASAALTRAPASSLQPRSASAAVCAGGAVVRTLTRAFALVLALLVLLLFLAEAAARLPFPGGAACRAPPPAADPPPLALLLRSLGLSSSVPPHRLSPREHLEGAAASIAALASSRYRAAVAEKLRSGGILLGGGGDREL